MKYKKNKRVRCITESSVPTTKSVELTADVTLLILQKNNKKKSNAHRLTKVTNILLLESPTTAALGTK